MNLAKSHYLKTCTRCSQDAGFPVWLPYPDAFGKRRMPDGTLTAQPQCYRCRAKAWPKRRKK